MSRRRPNPNRRRTANPTTRIVNTTAQNQGMGYGFTTSRARPGNFFPWPVDRHAFMANVRANHTEEWIQRHRGLLEDQLAFIESL